MDEFLFDKKEHQFPKTYVPNVIMVCVDTNKAIVKDIQLVEGRQYSNGHETII